MLQDNGLEAYYNSFQKKYNNYQQRLLKLTLFMKIKYLLSLIFFLKISIGLSQAQGVGLYIIEDSVIVQLNDDRRDVIIVNIRVENNTDSAIIFNKQTGIKYSDFWIEEKFVTDFCETSFCETSDNKDRLMKFLFSDNNELLFWSSFNLYERPYFTKSGKIKTVRTHYEYYFLFNIRYSIRYKKVSRLSAREEARDVKVSILPNKSLTYKVNVYVGDYGLQKDKVYYLMLAYNNKSVDGLSKICLVSNRLKVVTR